MKVNSIFPSIIASTLALTSCATPEQDAARASGICKSGGVIEGTPQFQSCVSTEASKIQDDRAQMGAALAIGMQAYSRGQASYQSTYRPTVYCTSNAVGDYMYTNCR